MPYGRYPERVKAFRKWSTERIDKAQINDSVTSTGGKTRRRRRRGRTKRRLKKEE